MEIVHMMFEKYGGRQMACIFRSYLVLAVILKELMFSLFMMPEDRHIKDPTPQSGTHIPYKFKAAEPGKASDLFRDFHLMLTVKPADKLSLPETSSLRNSLPPHETR